VAMATILTLVQKKCTFKIEEVTRATLEEGMAKLQADTPAAWGMMTPQHMVEHLEYFLKMAAGKVDTEIVTLESRIERMQESLYTYRPMPREFSHPLFRKGEVEDLRFASLDEAKEAMLKAYDEYILFYKENPDATAANTIFGNLNDELWELLNRKHINHHFEQFGLV